MQTSEEKEEKIDVQGDVGKSKVPYKARQIKCIVAAVASLSLIVVAAIFFVLLWPKYVTSRCLVDVNLKEGDTLIYRVDQTFEVKEEGQKTETIASIVDFQVVNKTSSAYWFLLKINTTFKDKNGAEKAAITGYFRVRLPTSTKNHIKEMDNETTEVFDLHGYPQTDGEFVRYLHGLLYQLLPEVRRDLYEDIDGQTDKNVKPVNSPLFPSPVRMHRQANTKQSGDVMIKTLFNQSDLVNSSSDMDLDIEYSDSAAINKSNGMVSESNITVSEQLHLGEPIKTKDGRDITTMTVQVYSHVIRIEMDSSFFEEKEMKALKMNLFVRLVVPRSRDDDTLGGKLSSTQEPTTVVRRRNRRAAPESNNTTSPKPREGEINGTEGPLVLPNPLDSSAAIQKDFSLFDKTFIGIRTRGSGSDWIRNAAVGNEARSWEIGTDLKLAIGSIEISIYSVAFNNEDIENALQNELETFGKEISYSWDKGIPYCRNVLIVRFCVEFTLEFQFNIIPKLLLEELSIRPVKFALEVESSAGVTAVAEAYASVWIVRAGIFAEGTLVQATIPAKLSYSAVKPANQHWCLATNAQLTVLEVHAGLFYQWRKCRFVLGGLAAISVVIGGTEMSSIALVHGVLFRKTLANFMKLAFSKPFLYAKDLILAKIFSFPIFSS